MKRAILSLFAAFFTAAALCACGSGNEAPRAVSSESTSEPYPIAEAESLVRPWDSAMAWLGAQDEITRAEGEAIERDVDAFFSGEGLNALGMYVDMAQWEDKTVDAFPIVRTSFCPTMFHEGVEITDAVQITDVTEYDDGTVLERTQLEITETYTGADEALADWYRTYVFDLSPEGEWEFFSFEGQANFGGEGWSSDYLPLKKPADEIYTVYA